VTFSCPGDECAAELGYGACTLGEAEQALAGRLVDMKEAA